MCGLCGVESLIFSKFPYVCALWCGEFDFFQSSRVCVWALRCEEFDFFKVPLCEFFFKVPLCVGSVVESLISSKFPCLWAPYFCVGKICTFHISLGVGTVLVWISPLWWRLITFKKNPCAGDFSAPFSPKKTLSKILHCERATFRNSTA